MSVQPSHTFVSMIAILLHSPAAGQAMCTTCLNDHCTPDGVCQEGCKQGFYGDECSRKCRDQCVGSRCHVSLDTGSAVCDTGCNPGFRGRYCERKCPRRCAVCSNTICHECTNSSWYGENCAMYCSHCNDKSCYKNGNCKRGCTRRTVGPGCETMCSSPCSECKLGSNTCSACIAGYYGKNCLSNCSSNCFGSLCHFSNGTCTHGCLSGWVGQYCTKQQLLEDRPTTEPVDEETMPDGEYDRGDGGNDKTLVMLIIFGSVTGFLVSCSVGVSLWQTREVRRFRYNATAVSPENANHVPLQLLDRADPQSYLTATHDIHIPTVEAHIYDEIQPV